jgi:hypothetical protein
MTRDSGELVLPFQRAVLKIGGLGKGRATGVIPFEEIDFPVAFPFLDLFLALKRGGRGFVNLKPHESFHIVPLGEAGNEPVLVLPNSPHEIGGCAYV